MVGATGEARYCAHGISDLVQNRKKQAFASIAEVCGGQDKYSISGEMSSPAVTTAMGIEDSCKYGAGRAIVFKCKGLAPRPTGLTK